MKQVRRYFTTPVVSKTDIQYIMLVVGGTVSFLATQPVGNLLARLVPWPAFQLDASGNISQYSTDALARANILLAALNVFGVILVLLLGFGVVYQLMKAAKLPVSPARFKRGIAILAATTLVLCAYVTTRFADLSNFETAMNVNIAIFTLPGIMFAVSWFVAGRFTSHLTKKGKIS